MTPHEAFEQSVNQLLTQIEENYQSLLGSINAQGNALMKHIYLTDVIDMMHKAPPIEGVMKEALLLRLYMMRSEIATDAEFIKIAYNK